MSRSRAWCYTINNYSLEEHDAVRGLDCVYNVFAEEVGESGTPHLQGYIHFATLKSLSQLKKLMPRAYLAVRKGTIDEAVNYCKKDGKYEEVGVKPASQEEKGQRGKAKMTEILKRAREGDEQWLEETHPGEYYRHLATFRSHKKPKTEIMDELQHEWWVGETGTGKSRKLWADHPDHYRKELNKWWCGYTGQDVVAIEEASPATCQHLASRVKMWADRYPFDGEIKGGKLHGIRPIKVIVLSNYTIEECFPAPQDHEPLNRRFSVVRFGSPPPAIHPFFNI